jgi:hypothetical protein
VGGGRRDVVAGEQVDGDVTERGARADRGWSSHDLIDEWPRRAAIATVVGFVVGFVVGGLGGRLAMRILTITSDDRLRGVLTDDDEPVNRFTFSGTLGLAIFLGLGGIVIALVYLAGRDAAPSNVRLRAAVMAVLFWGVQGSDMFDPDGFDFTRLTPVWLGVLLFTAILLGVGALIPIGVERAIERWPTTWQAKLPAVLLVPTIFLAGLAVACLAVAELVARLRVARIVVRALVAAALVIWVPPTAADVLRILT